MALETSWRHSLAGCHFKDVIVKGLVTEALEGGQYWEEI